MHTSNYEASNSMNISVGNTSEVGLYTLKCFKAIVNLSVRTNIVQKKKKYIQIIDTNTALCTFNCCLYFNKCADSRHFDE